MQLNKYLAYIVSCLFKGFVGLFVVAMGENAYTEIVRKIETKTFCYTVFFYSVIANLLTKALTTQS